MSKTKNIMIIDDEDGIREEISDFLLRLNYKVNSFSSPVEGVDQLRISPPDLLLLDIRMPEMSGMDVLKIISRELPKVSVIMVSGHGTMDIAIDSLRCGAADFIKKPVDFRELEACIDRCLQEQKKPDKTAVNAPDLMIGKSPATEDTRRLLQLAADSPCQSILITGETGTGKEVAAGLFHKMKHADKAPFVALNCPALPESLVESELFGHSKGAFTGAVSDHKGAFEQADKGTLFLDEIGDLSPIAQAKLLRVLETRTLRRVGSSKDIKIDVNVVTATNRSLSAEVEEGTFRQDLFFRLNSFVINLTPLRNRREDILLIARHLLELFTENSDMAAPALSSEAEKALEEYSFPGNVRELRNIIERASIMAGGKTIEKENLSFAYTGKLKDTEVPAPQASGAVNSEREATENALLKTGWNRKKAARLLDISYDALRWRIRKYKLRKPEELL